MKQSCLSSQQTRVIIELLQSFTVSHEFVLILTDESEFLLCWAEQVIDGLDRAVMTMKKGEVALLTIAPEYAFGSSESQQESAVVPPNSTLYYEVELVSFIKVNE